MKHSAAFVVAASLILTAAPIGDAAGEATYPSQSIEFVVHTNPGDSIDLFLRNLGEILTSEGLVSQPIQVVNRVGGSSAVANAYVAGKKGEAYTLISSQPSQITTPLRQGLSFSWRDLTPVANLMYDENTIAVLSDSPYQTIQDWLDAAKAEPNAITHGTPVFGAADYIVANLIQDDQDIELNLLAHEGAAENLTSLLNRSVDSIGANPSELVELQKSGRVRILAVASPQRSPVIPDVPTLKESGIDVEFYSFRGIMLPGEAPQQAIDFWREVIAKAVETDAWRKFVEANNSVAYYRPGDEFRQILEDNERLYIEIFKGLGVIK